MGFLRLGAPKDTGAQSRLKRYYRSINDPSPSPTGNGEQQKRYARGRGNEMGDKKSLVGDWRAW
jgi:hypothetical protein